MLSPRHKFLHLLIYERAMIFWFNRFLSRHAFKRCPRVHFENRGGTLDHNPSGLLNSSLPLLALSNRKFIVAVATGTGSGLDKSMSLIAFPLLMKFSYRQNGSGTGCSDAGNSASSGIPLRDVLIPSEMDCGLAEID